MTLEEAHEKVDILYKKLSTDYHNLRKYVNEYNYAGAQPKTIIEIAERMEEYRNQIIAIFNEYPHEITLWSYFDKYNVKY